MNRRETLEAALSCIMGDRQAAYDSPERNFARIAAMWTAYLGRPIAPHDVAAMLALVKLARIVTSPTHQDNWTDLAGYAACGAEVATEPQP